MKKVIYTCIVNGYDRLRQPEVVDDSFDYICFTNDSEPSQDGVWQIRPIGYDDDDCVRQSRYVKLQPHKVLSGYSYSVWIDANVVITGKAFYDTVNKRIDEGALRAQVPLFGRDCIYQVMPVVYEMERIGFREAYRQKCFLRQEGFPPHFGLMENNIILRAHNDPQVREVSDLWWREFLLRSHRDQLTLMYVYWKLGFRPSLLLEEGKNIRTVPFLRYEAHDVNKVDRKPGFWETIALKMHWKLIHLLVRFLK